MLKLIGYSSTSIVVTCAISHPISIFTLLLDSKLHLVLEKVGFAITTLTVEYLAVSS